MGEAAGVAAALAVEGGISVKEVPVAQLQRVLQRYGARLETAD
jgi:hypothetical protein